MPPQAYAFGDRLTHAAKPEWGVGEVVAAQNVQQDGQACQRLQVRFERAGLKTLSTAVANLRPAAAAGARTPAAAEPVDLSDPVETMCAVPEPARDPFATPAARLEATLDLYRYTPTGASLLDWAARQSGLADPLERFNRHELEAFFERFRFNLDGHLAKVVREVRVQDPQALQRIVAAAPAEARQAVKRLNGRG